MDTYLAPIEKPSGFMMKLAYYFTRRQFGKVLTPLKVHSARLPSAFGLFYGKVGTLDEKTAPAARACLSHTRTGGAHQHPSFLHGYWPVPRNQSINEQAKFDALEHYQTSPLFTEAERAALDYVTELTRNKKVSPTTFTRLARHYPEREICEIVWLVASEHLYNMTNIGLNIHSDMLCDITRKHQH